MPWRQTETRTAKVCALFPPRSKSVPVRHAHGTPELRVAAFVATLMGICPRNGEDDEISEVDVRFRAGVLSADERCGPRSRPDQSERYYKDHDREAIRGWYDEHHDHLPPGLAKRDQLPPGLEKQLMRRGELPPGLQKRLQPCPEDLERRLPPPPPDCAHVLIGGHIVLLNRRSNIVVDVFHFEIR